MKTCKDIPFLPIRHGRIKIWLASVAMVGCMWGHAQNSNLDLITSFETSIRYKRFIVGLRPFEYLVIPKALRIDEFGGYHLAALKLDVFLALRSDSRGRLFTGCRIDKRYSVLDNRLKVLLRLEAWQALNPASRNIVQGIVTSAYDLGPGSIGFLYLFQAVDQRMPRHYLGPSINLKLHPQVNLYYAVTKDVIGSQYFALVRMGFSKKF